MFCRIKKLNPHLRCFTDDFQAMAENILFASPVYVDKQFLSIFCKRRFNCLQITMHSVLLAPFQRTIEDANERRWSHVLERNYLYVRILVLYLRKIPEDEISVR